MTDGQAYRHAKKEGSILLRQNSQKGKHLVVGEESHVFATIFFYNNDD